MRRKQNGFECYEELFMQEYLPVYKYIRRMIRDDIHEVEDLTQEVFLFAYERWDTEVKDHPNVPGFLIKVAQFKLKKWYRKRSRYYVDETEVLDYLEDISFAETIKKFLEADFYAVLEKYLSVEEIDLLRYYYVYNYTSHEMAQLLNINESSFRMRMTRMRNKLKKHLSSLLGLMVFVVCCI